MFENRQGKLTKERERERGRERKKERERETEERVYKNIQSEYFQVSHLE